MLVAHDARPGIAAELDVFSLRFDASAQQVNATLQAALERKALAATACAEQIVYGLATAPFSGYSPQSVAAFNALVPDVMGDATFMYTCALVTDATRPSFEAGAAAAAAAATNATAVDAVVNALQAFGVSDTFPPSGLAPTHPAPAPYYLPLLHIAPQTVPLSHFVMYNVVSQTTIAARREAFRAAVETGRPAWSDLLESTILTAGTVAPANIVVVPALSPAAAAAGLASGANATLGICAVVFDWKSVLLRALPAFITSVTAVLTSASGQQATFALSGGEVTIVGRGDLHDASFDSLARVAVANVSGGSWTLHMYPTAALLESYSTAGPARNAAIIASTLTFCAALFAFYELHVRRRAAAMNALLRANLARLAALKEEEAAAQARLHAAGLKQQDEFVSMVSHEIRTPLNAINGAAALLADTGPLSAEQRELLALLDAGSAHVSLIIEDILLHGALNSGNFTIAREPLHLASAMLEPCWAMVRMNHKLRDKLATIAFSCTVAADVPDMILGDATRLLQVLVNLLSNSSKFTPAHGRVTLAVDVTPDGLLRFRVTDTGIGLAPDKLQAVFLPFTQAESTTVRQYGGTGLGLTICKRIAGAMGGALVAHSDGLGKGTTMEFTIPLLPVPRRSRRSSTSAAAGAAAAAMARLSSSHLQSQLSSSRPCSPCSTHDAPSSPTSPTSPASPASTAADAPAAPRASLDAPHARVLVAEDDRLSQTIMRKLLPKMGFAPTVVENGALAIDAAVEAAATGAAFDLILLDLQCVPRQQNCVDERVCLCRCALTAPAPLCAQHAYHGRPGGGRDAARAPGRRVPANLRVDCVDVGRREAALPGRRHGCAPVEAHQAAAAGAAQRAGRRRPHEARRAARRSVVVAALMR